MQATLPSCSAKGKRTAPFWSSQVHAARPHTVPRVLVSGGGPAGLTAAIVSHREGANHRQWKFDQRGNGSEDQLVAIGSEGALADAEQMIGSISPSGSTLFSSCPRLASTLPFQVVVWVRISGVF